MRVVLDTNVVVSALIKPDSAPGHVLELAVTGKVQLVLSAALIDELRRTLRRPAVRKYIKLSEDEVALRLIQLQVLADTVPGRQRHETKLRDPDDVAVPAAALEGRAAAIVTGDRDLLTLAACEDVPILSPRQFLEFLGD